MAGSARYRILSLLTAALIFLSAPLSARAEVFIGKEKPEDWDERELLTVVCAETPANDAIFIFQGKKKMLVDGGGHKVKPRIARYIKDHGMADMDIVFNTHPHDDHLETVNIMIKTGELTPKKVLSPFKRSYKNELLQTFLGRLDERKIPYVRVKDGDRFSLGKAEFTVIHWSKGLDPNQLSGILMLRFGDATMMLTGDMTGRTQEWMLEKYKDSLHADILKVPHHGIGRIILAEFLEAVSPEFAFITNRPEGTSIVNKQLAKAGIPYMHHSKGAIIMETDGKDWYITQVRGLFPAQ